MDRLLRRLRPRPVPADLQSLEKIFTDVDELRQLFDALMAEKARSKRILVIYGVGGVGKSSLLMMFQLSCIRGGTPVALVGLEVVKGIPDLLATLAEQLSRSGVRLTQFSRTLNRYVQIQGKVAQKLEGAKQSLAFDVGKRSIGGLTGAAIGTIPGIGPLIGAVAGVSAEALIDLLRDSLSKADLEFFLDPTAELTQAFEDDINDSSRNQRVVLMFDTYEQVGVHDRWMLDFVKSLHPNVLVVIAGRKMPTDNDSWTRNWPSWVVDIQSVELKSMKDENMSLVVRRYYEQVQHKEPAPEQVEAVVRFARGLPLVGTTAARLWAKYGVEDFQSVRGQVVADVVRRLLEGLPSELVLAIEAAATVRWFDRSLLRAMLETDIDDRLYDDLTHWPFVRSTTQGKFRIHDDVRYMIHHNLKSQDPNRCNLLHLKAANFLRSQLKKSQSEPIDRITPELLYHQFQIDEDQATVEYTQICEDLADAHLVQHLRTILAEGEKHEWLDPSNELWHRYYTARLRYLEGETETTPFDAIASDDRASPLLKAYALCDLGRILTKWERLGQVDGVARAKRVLDRSLSYGPVDTHLTESLYGLSRVHIYAGQWDQALKVLVEAKSVFADSEDDLGTIYAANRLKAVHVLRGDWPQMREAHSEALALLARHPKSLYLRAEALGHWSWALALAGHYAEAERDSQESVSITRRLELTAELPTRLRNLGIAYGLQLRYSEADACFDESVNAARKLGSDYSENLATTLRWWGLVVSWNAQLSHSKDLLEQSLRMAQDLQDRLGIPEAQVWLGLLHELEHNLLLAAECYQQSLKWKWLGRQYVYCEALLGLCRTRFGLGDSKGLLELVQETKTISERYGYYDHLANLNLLQAHMVEHGIIEDSNAAPPTTLGYYKAAMVAALRHNRFLLDEIVVGLGRLRPIDSIMAHCPPSNKEGELALRQLRAWWTTSRREPGQILDHGAQVEGTWEEAEQAGRTREPGDGTPQTSVRLRIDAALGGY